MSTITPHTKIDPASSNADVDRRVRSLVTIDDERYGAWLELFDAYGLDTEDVPDLSADAILLMRDMGWTVADLDDVSMWDWLEGVLDWRVVLDSRGEVMEFQLLTGFGGPSVWLHVFPDGGARVEVYWWGTRGTGTGRHEFFARVFECMCELREVGA